jgi:sarcosine oxidase
MNREFDAIVLGLGAMGSASLYQLAKRGAKVLGIDQFSPPHTLGSTHGDTRITRQAIGEGEYYTPLSLRSYELFRELEKTTGRSLLQVTGGLIISSDTKTGGVHVDNLFEVTVRAAKQFGIKHDLLDAKDIRARFPQFNVSDTEYGYYEYEAGILRPEECVRAALESARAAGAAIKTETAVKTFEEKDSGVRVVCADGDEFFAQKLIVCAGAWLPEMIGAQYARFFSVYRQVLYWFDTGKAYQSFLPERMPIFIWEVQNSDTESMYGFPAVDGPRGGFKIATEQFAEKTSATKVDRAVSQAEIEHMQKTQVERYFPLAGSHCVKTAVCIYTATPDSGFVIDYAPGSSSILLCSPCSGHGFKHSAAIGESVAELVLTGSSAIDLSHFRLNRFTVELATTDGAEKVTDS